MAYFLSREDPIRPQGKRASLGQNAESCSNPVDPSSPLTRFVRDGYSGKPSAGRPPLRPSEGGFDAGVAEQWSGNVQRVTAAHQQELDPTFVKLKAKSHGMRISQAAGGQSSLSLAWDGAPTTEEPPRRGRAGGYEQPVPHSIVGGSPFNLGNASDVPATSGGAAALDLGGRAGGSPGGPGPSRADLSAQRIGAASHLNGGGASRSPASGHGGNLSQQEAYAIAANRQRSGSGAGGARTCVPSYGGPNGNGGQNVGNQIGNRNSSRVLAPPGGFSSFSLG
eukprot:TRINITY_DN62850_c0_g1_i1.p1 TRINITY_DN62850_c0_g1~~TRINITY_DN62850_c0_g1_i1.p1  ORF type:complete len:280 (-),score=20.91 TRINITY_DN62850_c0_g1_i1:143-982(-)